MCAGSAILLRVSVACVLKKLFTHRYLSHVCWNCFLVIGICDMCTENAMSLKVSVTCVLKMLVVQRILCGMRAECNCDMHADFLAFDCYL